ncbi:hypothetical protein F5B21DRAFT_502255 [Xylaria acuta]|nr:hypothetical protein F5B21DRAFT_502255 [Xylaria acuta]
MAESNAPPPLYELAPDVLDAEMRPNHPPTHGTSTHDAQAPHTLIPTASNPIPSTNPSTPSHGLTGQCLITRWQPFEPVFYSGTPSKVTGANEEVESPARQRGLSSPYRPRAPEAQMYAEGQQPLSDLANLNVQHDLKASEEANETGESSSGSALVSGAPYLMTECSSDTSETLTSGDDSDTLNGNSNEDNGAGAGAGYNINGADGVIDTRTIAARNHGYYDDDAVAGVDVDNSLRIDEAGHFHLGSQWQVPSSNTARSNAGSNFGQASVWSEWSEPRLDSTAPPSRPKVNPTPADEVMTGRMQTLDLANLHRPHEPLPGPSDGPMREGSRGCGSCAESQVTPAPLAAALNCHNYLYSDTEDNEGFVVTNKSPGESLIRESSQKHQDREWYQAAESYYDDFETENDGGQFVLREGPLSVDLSMRGAR